MITGGLETVLAGRICNGAPLAVGVHVTVGAASVAFRVRLFFELDAVALRVSGTELSVVGQVSGIGEDGSVLLGDDKRHRRQRHQDKYDKSAHDFFDIMSCAPATRKRKLYIG